jgi:4-oxalocrotonate tautomerase
MPFVTIRIVKEVLGEDAAEKKAAISSRVTDAIHDVTGIPKPLIWLVFEDTPAAEWYIGGATKEVPEASRPEPVAAGQASPDNPDPARRGPA